MEADKQPLVSIIMGVYNGAKRFEKPIESIINQTYTNWEFIICDDGSKDNSFNLLLKFQEKDARIRVIKNEKNSGLSASLNHCLKYARGEYIARMDDDDISHPNRLEEEVKFLAEHPEYAITATGYRLMDEKGFWGKNDSYGERTALDIFRGRYFAHPTVMVRKGAFDAVGGYSTDPKIGRMEDVDLWCKMYANRFKGYVMDAILYDYFESRDSMQRRKYKHRITEFNLKMKYRKEMGIPFVYSFLAAKTLLVGLLPPSIIKRIHSIQYR